MARPALASCGRNGRRGSARRRRGRLRWRTNFRRILSSASRKTRIEIDRPRSCCASSNRRSRLWTLGGKIVQTDPFPVGVRTPRAAARERCGGGHDFVMVANRLPVEFRKSRDGSVRWERSPGGLVGALEPVMQQRGGAWIGWSGSAGTAPDPFNTHGMHLVGVPLSERDIDRYYDGFSNATLWPLYHDAIATPVFNSQWWQTYVAVNDRFAAVAAACAADNATVWVHDYPAAVGAVLPAAAAPRRADRAVQPRPVPRIPEIFAQLPWRKQVVQGMLGADLIGFQRRADATNFLRACRLLAANKVGAGVQMPSAPNADSTGGALAPGGRDVRIGAYPISIDFARFDELARRDDVRARAREIRSQVGDPQVLLLGVDRLDYTKGILHRLRAYEQLLADGLMGPPRSVMVQIATPTRERVEQYKALLLEVEALVGRINGDHGTMSQPAVRYLHHGYPQEEIAALYVAADVMLVTSLRDGMNLVAKEYVSCRHDEQGALVLSEFAGSAEQLADAYLVNPHDIAGLKDAILRAAHVTRHESERRMRSLRHQVRTHDVHRWAASYLDALQPTVARTR